MSFLTPLYILGMLAIIGPILFHLIRRRPRSEVRFSSLMFLTPTPPNLTRKSRIDNWLLLLLRGLALALLVFAFARPFFREAALFDTAAVERNRVAVLVDTSASMRQKGAWPEAQQRAVDAINELGINDDVAVYSFDRFSRTGFTFAESSLVDPAQRRTIAIARVKELRPTWGATDLGQALIDIAIALQDETQTSDKRSPAAKRIVLISDVQRGSRLDALSAFEWPADVELDIRPVAVKAGNASIQVLDPTDPTSESESAKEVRVRLSNTTESTNEQFRLSWIGEGNYSVGNVTNAHVPSGESRVIRMSMPEINSQALTLELTGDAATFGNKVYFPAVPQQLVTIPFFGVNQKDDPEGLLYYLERAFDASGGDKIQVMPMQPTEPVQLDKRKVIPLVVIATDIATSNVGALSHYLSAGGTVLFVFVSETQANLLTALAGLTSSVEVSEGVVQSDVMLQEIQFDHPLFAPFAASQFNDFTKIRFWRYRAIDAKQIPRSKVIARFEGGDPALIEIPVGDGRLMILTSGWNPIDSQLARSSKFVPLVAQLVDAKNRNFNTNRHYVFDEIPLWGKSDAPISVVKPDGTPVGISVDRPTSPLADQPGIYRIKTSQETQQFAVNLDPAESRTDPLDLITFEQLGCRIAGKADAFLPAEDRRQLQSLELESRQKLWRWLVVVAIVVLIVESWLAGRRAQPRPVEVATT